MKLSDSESSISRNSAADLPRHQPCGFNPDFSKNQRLGQNSDPRPRLGGENAETREIPQSSCQGHALLSTHRLGEISVTRIILISSEDDAIFIHVHADQPGTINFAAEHSSEEPTEIRNRRELASSRKGVFAHTWIIPFESDVKNEGKSIITLSGEGEPLIVFNVTSDPEKHPVRDTWERIDKNTIPPMHSKTPDLICEAVKPSPGLETNNRFGMKFRV